MLELFQPSHIDYRYITVQYSTGLNLVPHDKNNEAAQTLEFTEDLLIFMQKYHETYIHSHSISIYNAFLFSVVNVVLFPYFDIKRERQWLYWMKRSRISVSDDCATYAVFVRPRCDIFFFDCLAVHNIVL